MAQTYADRSEAGKRLAEALQSYQGREGLVVLGLPRGGVPVAVEVARALSVPLDILLVRKLGVPGHEELAMGAIASGGAHVVNQSIIQRIGVPQEQVDQVVNDEEKELERRSRKYRGDKPFPKLKDHSVVLIDDGLATGATMRAAVSAVRQYNPREIVVAAPVAPPDAIETLKQAADDVVCPFTPSNFMGISQWYQQFEQLSDEQVTELLSKAS